MGRRFWPDRILPATQLVVCLVALWPARHKLLLEVKDCVRICFLRSPDSADKQNGHFEIPEWASPDQPTDDSPNAAGAGMRVPLILDCPVLLAELPYVILSPDKNEWRPAGFSLDIWRALSLPVAGMALWWLASRGLRALVCFGTSLPMPRISILETVIAAVLLACGLVAAVAIGTSTVADRRDLVLFDVMLGFCLWGILGYATLTARVLQWKVSRNKGSVAR